MSRTFVVVGAGMAAGKAVETLRGSGFTDTLVLYGDEHHLPYERPPLSKGFLLGEEDLGSAFVNDAAWYDEHDVELHLGTRVMSVDPVAHTVHTPDGARSYDRLLLATGATPRRLGAAAAPVSYLRTIEDSRRLKGSFAEGTSVVVIGGGWIGLEVAAAARTAGCEVRLLESADQPLLGVLGPEISPAVASLHREHGVDLRTGVEVASVDRAGERSVVRLADGDALDADLVVAGIGVTPSVSLAEAAGLAVEDGVLVDEHLCTSDPDVFAAGDMANAWHPVLDRRVRVEHWDTAAEQGVAAARNMLGRDEAYDRLPFFFSDQYDLGLEYVGSVGPDGYDEVVVRGDLDQRAFNALWVKDGTVVAGMHANDWDATDHLWRVVGRRLDPARLRNTGLPLEELSAGL